MEVMDNPFGSFGPGSEFEVTVISPDEDFIFQLQQLPAGAGAIVGSPAHIPGAVPGLFDVLSQIGAVFQNLEWNILGSLIAAWIWEAKLRSKKKTNSSTIIAHVEICSPATSVVVSVEAETGEEVKDIIETALKNARPNG